MHQIEHFELAKNDVVCLKLHAGCLVRVSHGRLWLTQPGQVQDVWLQPGESWTQAATGLVWLSAEPSAQFQLAHVAWPWPALRQLRQLFAARLRGSTWPSPTVQTSQAKRRFIAI
jgi:hypothetical protein